MSLIQAILIGFVSVLGASTMAMLGTTLGNYTLNRPLIGGMVVGIILGDISGVITVAIPMQVMWIALVTPGGTVASDLGAVSFIGIPLAYVGAKAAGWDLAGTDAQGLAASISAMTGVIGISMFYGSALLSLIWQHWGWAQLDKGNTKILGLVDVVLPWGTHFVLRFLPTTLLCYYGATVVAEVFPLLSTDAWYVKAMITTGAMLTPVGMGILLKSVVTKWTDLIFFAFGFVAAKSMGLGLIAATVVGGVFALINFQLMMAKSGAGAAADEEEDI